MSTLVTSSRGWRGSVKRERRVKLFSCFPYGPYTCICRGGILVHKSRRQKEFKWGKHRLSFSYFKMRLVHVHSLLVAEYTLTHTQIHSHPNIPPSSRFHQQTRKCTEPYTVNFVSFQDDSLFSIYRKHVTFLALNKQPIDVDFT
jgi:hypothetical protein